MRAAACKQGLDCKEISKRFGVTRNTMPLTLSHHPSYLEAPLIAQWPLPPARLLHKEISGGPLCFHKAHNLGAKDGRIPRYSDSHACIKCVAALSEGRFSIDVHQIEKKHRKNFLTFWSLVDIRGTDDCWTWEGKYNKNDMPIFPYAHGTGPVVVSLVRSEAQSGIHSAT